MSIATRHIGACRSRERLGHPYGSSSPGGGIRRGRIHVCGLETDRAGACTRGPSRSMRRNHALVRMGAPATGAALPRGPDITSATSRPSGRVCGRSREPPRRLRRCPATRTRSRGRTASRNDAARHLPRQASREYSVLTRVASAAARSGMRNGGPTTSALTPKTDDEPKSCSR
jgi:hypothetical protein